VTPTVLLLHAFPLDERMWEAQLEALDAWGVPAVAPRLYGRGPSIDAWAVQLLEEVAGELVAVGVSMGGYTALALARLAPERLSALLLASSRAERDSPERRAFRDRLVEQLQRDGPPEDAAYGVSADELVDATLALRDRPDATDVVRTFSGPLVVCAGDRDELFSPEEGRRLAELAPDGRFELFEGAGHQLSLEQPERFDDVLLEVVSRWKT
jgi:pimeloyl-ACP methyl ester carboxylesterase